MPRAALASADYVLELTKIGDILKAFAAGKNFK
jgi:hypothetical protein